MAQRINANRNTPSVPPPESRFSAPPPVFVPLAPDPGLPTPSAVLGFTFPRNCPVANDCMAFFRELVKTNNIAVTFFNPIFNKCYCRDCYPDNAPSVITEEGPSPYIVPRGWVRFGIFIRSGIPEQEQIFKKWSVSFHGTRADLLRSVLTNGLAMPDDKLLDGRTLKSQNCAGRQDKCIYTSPTIRYSGLAFYTNVTQFTTPDGRVLAGQTVLQCRQSPDSFKKQGETMGFKSRWKVGGKKLCPDLDNTEEIEWTTEIRPSVVPYGLIVRVFEPGRPPDFFESPVDEGRFDQYLTPARRSAKAAGDKGPPAS